MPSITVTPITLRLISGGVYKKTQQKEGNPSAERRHNHSTPPEILKDILPATTNI
jgi:hypothetical protein